MGLFGRKKKVTDEELLAEEEREELSPRPEPREGEPGVDRDWVREEDGPYDITEFADLDGRFDLGAIRVPVPRGTQVRLDVEPAPQGQAARTGQGQRVIGVTLGFGASQLQLQAFAAPRTLGIWDELRPEIARGLVDSGGAAEVVDGPLGKELRARMPGRAPDGRVAFQPARFLGVDGPRWFLRVVVSGPAATDDTLLRKLLPVVRGTVVTRGDEPRPPREVLGLTPPKEFLEALAAEARKQQEKARAEQRARMQRVAAENPSLRGQDASGVAGISPQAAQATSPAPTQRAGQAPQAEPQPEPTEAPKPPTNPDFT